MAPAEALSPFEAKKAELEADPGFAKFIKLYKMKVPMQSLRNQIGAVGIYDPDDILCFATVSAINAMKARKEYTGTKYPMEG